MTVRRNYLVNHPLMRKGGVHEQSRTGKRTQQRNALNKEADSYMDELEQFERAETVTPASQDAGDDFIKNSQNMEY